MPFRAERRATCTDLIVLALVLGERSGCGQSLGRKTKRARTLFCFWVEFEGEKVASYEKEDDVVYTLYKATAYDNEAYRVYISDETDPQSPKHELHPSSGDPFIEGVEAVYADPYQWEEVVSKYPLFVKKAAEGKRPIDHFQAFSVDPRR